MTAQNRLYVKRGEQQHSIIKGTFPHLMKDYESEKSEKKQEY